MDWALAGLTLVVVGYVFRRILRLDDPRPRKGLPPLPPERDEIYRSVSLELETQIALLAISLNDALGERDSGNEENAWRLVRLAIGQWDWLAEDAGGLLNVVAGYFPVVTSLGSLQELGADQFKSRAMIEFTNQQAKVHQVIFHTTPRHQSHIRIVRQAMDILTEQFRGAFTSQQHPASGLDAMWQGIDPSFHDFDLVIKQALLALRALVLVLPDSSLPTLAAELSGAVTHSVRSKSAVSAGRLAAGR
ncbi:MAG: hypothetical protein ACRD3D_04480 [Terriglobia bacterium]